LGCRDKDISKVRSAQKKSYVFLDIRNVIYAPLKPSQIRPYQIWPFESVFSVLKAGGNRRRVSNLTFIVRGSEMIFSGVFRGLAFVILMWRLNVASTALKSVQRF